MKSVLEKANIARTARMIERHIVGALLGVLLAVILVRLLLLTTDIETWGLLLILVAGALAGAIVSYASQRSHEKLFDSLRFWMPQVRAWSLKSLLWLLGTAAVIGVVAVLISGSDVLVRTAITVLVTAIGAGLLSSLSLMLDERKTLAAGLLGVISVLVVYCLVIPLIWELDCIDDELWMTSLAVGLMAPWGMAALLMRNMPQARIAGQLGTALYVVLLLIFLIAAWSPPHVGVRAWAEFGSWVAPYGAISVFCLVGWIPWKWRDWRWLGVTVSVIACCICNWVDVGRYSFAFKVVTILTSVGLVVAHTSLTQLVPLRSRQNWVRAGTRFAVILTALFVNLELLVYFPRREPDLSFLARIAGAAAIVASCGSLALLLLARLNRDRRRNGHSVELTTIKLVCPECGRKQTLAIGGDECARCGLRIDVSAVRSDATQTLSSEASPTLPGNDANS